MTSIVRCSNDVMSVNALTPYVRGSIKKVIEEEGFSSYEVDVKNISTNGGNYFAELQAVSIKGQSKDGKHYILNLFLKNIIGPIDNSAAVCATDLYLREGFVYNKLFKMIEKIEENYNISQQEGLNFPKPYGEINDKVIIMEDVSKLGFKTYDRHDVIPVKFAELSIEQLAKFHALSFVIQKEYPKYFEQEIKTLKTVFLENNDDLRIFMRKSCDKALESLDGNAKTRLDNFFPKLFDLYENCYHVPADKAICFIHGDFRPNNILVQEIDGEIKKVIPVDYQTAHFGYPIIDFIYFIFVSTDRKFRAEHLDNLKNLYYNTFANFLRKFDIEAQDVYSRKQFEQEYTDKLAFGLGCFLLAMPFLFAKDGAIPDTANGMRGVSFEMDDSHKGRLHEIVDDFIQWGYL